MLKDVSNILDERREEVLDLLESAQSKKATPKKKKKEDDESKREKSKASYNVLRWKKINELLNKEEQPVKKKRKKEVDDVVVVVNISSLTDTERKEALAYNEYSTFNIDGLKDVLRYNRQFLGGTKDVLIQRIVDGHVYGRLGSCPSCSKGRLKLNDEGDVVSCPGYYDEEVGARMSCYYSIGKEDANRLQPWFQDEPTEEEDEMMDKQLEQTTTSSSTSKSKDDKRIKKLHGKIKDNIEWNVSSGKGVKETTKSLYPILRTILDLPSEERAAMTEIGKLLLQHCNSKSMEEVIVLLVQQFPF